MTLDQLLAALRERGVSLEARDGQLHFKAPKGALTDELKAALKSAKADVLARLEDEAESLGLVLMDRAGALPLSFQQERFFLLERLEPGCGAYLVPVAATLRGPLDAGALEGAVAELVRRNEVLRCVVDAGGETLRQRPLAEDAYSFASASLGATSTSGAIAGELAEPIDLESGPLLRVRLWKTADDEHVLFLLTHLYCGDGWSLEHLLSQLSALYGDLAAARRPSLPEQPLQYVDFAAWQRRSSGEAFEEQLVFWERALEGSQGRLEIPTDRRRALKADSASRRFGFTLSEACGAKVRAAAVRERATPFAVLLAGLETLLARYCGTDDVVVGTITSNRGRLETERMLGSFSNTVFLRGRIDVAAPFDRAVQSAQQQLLDGGAHQDVPTELLAERFELSGRRLPELQVLVIYHESDPVDLLQLGDDLHIERVNVDPGGTRVDWNLSLEAVGETFAGELDLPSALYDEAAAAAITADLEALLLAGTDEGASCDDVTLSYTGTWQPADASARSVTSPAAEDLSPTEAAIRDAWLAHLEVEDVGRHENFFDVGGHSLAAIEVIARLESELGVRLDVGDFMMQTLAQVAATCDERKEVAPVEKGERAGMFSRMFKRRSK